MKIRAKIVTPLEMNNFAQMYLYALAEFQKKMEDYRYAEKNPYYNPLKYPWLNLINRGQLLADAVLGTKEIPKGLVKTLELAARLFMSAKRAPKDIVVWADKNEKLLNFLLDASRWTDKVEGAEDSQLYKLGPFTVHNTLGLVGDALDKINKVLLSVEKRLKKSRIPGISQTLYGNVYIVGKLKQADIAAWYSPADDALYVRPLKNASIDEVHSFAHELGHRYWRKFMAKDRVSLWSRYYSRNSFRSGNAPKPMVGDILPLKVQGIKGEAKITKIEVNRGRIVLVLNEDSMVPYDSVMRILNAKTIWPSVYSQKDEEEFFCECLGFIASGTLQEPFATAFDKIVIEGVPMEIELKTAAVSFVDDGVKYTWKRHKSDKFGPAPEFRGWALESKDRGLLAQLRHTHYVEPWRRIEGTPEWMISVRVLASPSEVARYGKFKDVTLKTRVPSLDGTEGTEEAQRIAVQTYAKLKEQQKMKTAASTYVEITRQELEAWLTGLPYPWDRVSGTEGIYRLNLSDTVAIKLSTTLGGKGKVMQVGQASMQLALVSVITGQTVNKKAQGQSHFARTLGWKKNWLEGINRMEDAYRAAAGFYDVIAGIADRETYQRENLANIETIPWWTTDVQLSRLHDKLQQRGVLMPQDQNLIEDEKARIEELLKDLREIYKKAHANKDQAALKFLAEIGKKIKEGKTLSQEEWKQTKTYIGNYRMASSMMQKILRTSNLS